MDLLKNGRVEPWQKTPPLSMTRPRNSLALKGWLNGHYKLGKSEYAAYTGDGAGRLEAAKLARPVSRP